MPRVKRASVPSLSLPTIRTISWTPEAEEALTNDLDLNIRNPRHKKRCDGMLKTLASELENYNWWEEHRENYPSRSSRLEEFKITLPVLEKAFERLDRLSHAALDDIKNSGRCWKEEATPRHRNATIGPDRPVEKHDFIHARDVRLIAQSALMDLIVHMKRAGASITTEERRGRPGSTLSNLIDRTTKIFEEYYNGGNRGRKEALKHFLGNAFRYSRIRIPSRLNPLLQK